jgi:hypothetical protein
LFHTSVFEIPVINGFLRGVLAESGMLQEVFCSVVPTYVVLGTASDSTSCYIVCHHTGCDFIRTLCL